MLIAAAKSRIDFSSSISRRILSTRSWWSSNKALASSSTPRLPSRLAAAADRLTPYFEAKRHIHHPSSNNSSDKNMPSTSSSDVTSSHYQGHSAESYEQAYFYEAGAYQQYLVNLVQSRLDLTTTTFKERHILDIGGGTGNFAQALLDSSKNNNLQITVVDPFLLDPALVAEKSSPQLGFVCESAEAFLTPPNKEESWRSNFHQVLMKEVVHHLDDRVGIFRGMHQDLQVSSSSSSSIPSILIITRPQIDIDYPLWDAARQVWKDNQPSCDELCRELQQAGFVGISSTIEAYPCQISLQRWQSMIQQRFWSTFSNFSDLELQNACQQIALEYRDRIDADGMLHFEDRLVFITARKE